MEIILITTGIILIAITCAFIINRINNEPIRTEVFRKAKAARIKREIIEDKKRKAVNHTIN